MYALRLRFQVVSVAQTYVLISVYLFRHYHIHLLGIHSIVIELFPSVPLRTVEDVDFKTRTYLFRQINFLGSETPNLLEIGRSLH